MKNHVDIYYEKVPILIIPHDAEHCAKRTCKCNPFPVTGMQCAYEYAGNIRDPNHAKQDADMFTGPGIIKKQTGREKPCVCIVNVDQHIAGKNQREKEE